MTWSDVAAFLWDELTRPRFSVLFVLGFIVVESFGRVAWETWRERA